MLRRAGHDACPPPGSPWGPSSPFPSKVLSSCSGATSSHTAYYLKTTLPQTPRLALCIEVTVNRGAKDMPALETRGGLQIL